MIWLLRRTGFVLLLSLGIFLASHIIIRLIPGDPVDVIMAETGTSIAREVLIRDLHLDESWSVAGGKQVLEAVRGNLGQSIHYKAPIAPILFSRAKHSVTLAILAMGLGLAISLTLSLFSLVPSRVGRAIRIFGHIYSAVLAAAPAAWIAPIFSFFLCVHWRIFSVSGSLPLCVFVLGVTLSGFWVRVFTRTMADEKLSDHYRSAEARGTGEFRLLLKHALAPVSGSLLAYLGTQVGWLAAGAVITETVFDWPGLGSLLIESILKRDYPLMEMTICFTSLLIFFGNTLGDLLQILVHPKVREEELG